MGWARLDDSFHDHPKLIGLSLEALGLWVKCFTWAHRHHGSSGDLGFIPVDLPRTFAGNRASRLSSELVSKKLWDNFHGGEGWVIHDYVDYLPASERPATASKVSKSRSEAGSRGAAARWGKANEWQADSKLLSDVDSKPMPPTRPDPTRPTTSNEVVKTTRSQGSRLSPDWLPSAETVATIKAECPAVDPQKEHRVFVDYWIAQTGTRATKRDWDATWRNWMRRKQTDHKGKPTPTERARATLQLATDIDMRELTA